MLVAYGPVMLHEALTAAELLAGRGSALAVVAMPWLNRVDGDWLAGRSPPYRACFVVEDHAPVGALGDALRRALGGSPPSTVLGVEGWPACGTPAEALRYHGLDGASLADRVAATPSRRQRVMATAVWVVVADSSRPGCSSTRASSTGSRERLGDRLALIFLLGGRGRANGQRARRRSRARSEKPPSVRVARPSGPRGGSTHGSTGSSATSRSRSASTTGTDSTASGWCPGMPNRMLDSSRAGPLPARADRASDAAMALRRAPPRPASRSSG